MNPHHKSRIKSFGHAIDGIGEALKTQFNFRLHVAAALLVTGAGLIFHIPAVEWCIVVLAIGLVAAAECFNTAMEYLTDLAMPEHHAVAGKIKDLAAGAVLICAVAAAIAGLMVFVPRIASFM